MSMNLEINKVFGWMGVIMASRVRANNMGVAADPTKTTDAEWRKLSQCIDGAPSSVRTQWREFCKRDGVEQCMISGGMQRLQQLAVKHGCGNCQEKAAVAFMFLTEVGVHQLDYMELTTNNGIDHTFVAIGRVRRGTDTDPKTWGPDAVVCDPWHDYGKVYPATDLEANMYRGPAQMRYIGTLQPRTIFRLE